MCVCVKDSFECMYVISYYVCILVCVSKTVFECVCVYVYVISYCGCKNSSYIEITGSKNLYVSVSVCVYKFITDM